MKAYNDLVSAGDIAEALADLNDSLMADEITLDEFIERQDDLESKLQQYK